MLARCTGLNALFRKAFLMQQTPHAPPGWMPESAVTRGYAAARLGIGLVQGVSLYLLYESGETRSWLGNHGCLFAPLLLVVSLIPFLLISALGHLRQKTAAIWLFSATVIVAALGFYDRWRSHPVRELWFDPDTSPYTHYPSWPLFVFLPLGLFIAHSLILAAAQERKRLASYPAYFEAAWKLFIQLQFSALFVAALWLILLLGADLFELINLGGLKHLLEQPWFNIPVTTFAAASAIHLTDVRPAIIRGIRGLVLVLLSWILPLATVLIAAFLASLPFTGLAPLWGTRHATDLLLVAAAALVILINAAFQNSEVAAEVARPVRYSARLASFLLLPLMAIAIYALALRVMQYGWSADRVSAAASELIGLCYAVGYFWAGLSRGGWLRPIARVNVWVAWLMIAIMLALFSPIADPARIAVNNQMARFTRGQISVVQLDFTYLRFDGARYGIAALKQLKDWQTGQDAATVRANAQQALSRKGRYEEELKPRGAVDLAANITVWPKGSKLPPSFLQHDWSKMAWMFPKCVTEPGKKCDAYPIDFNGDSKPEILLVGTEQGSDAVLVKQGDDGQWLPVGNLPYAVAGCATWRQQMQAGNYHLVTPPIKDLQIGGQLIQMPRPEVNSLKCPDNPPVIPRK